MYKRTINTDPLTKSFKEEYENLDPIVKELLDYNHIDEAYKKLFNNVVVKDWLYFNGIINGFHRHNIYRQNNEKYHPDDPMAVAFIAGTAFFDADKYIEDKKFVPYASLAILNKFFRDYNDINKIYDKYKDIIPVLVDNCVEYGLVTTLLEYGNFLYRYEKFEEAVFFYEKFIDKAEHFMTDPYNMNYINSEHKIYNIVFRVAQYYLYKSDYEKSTKYFEKLALIDTDDICLWSYAYMLYKYTNNRDFNTLLKYFIKNSEEAEEYEYDDRNNHIFHLPITYFDTFEEIVEEGMKGELIDKEILKDACLVICQYIYENNIDKNKAIKYYKIINDKVQLASIYEDLEKYEEVNKCIEECMEEKNYKILDIAVEAYLLRDEEKYRDEKKGIEYAIQSIKMSDNEISYSIIEILCEWMERRQLNNEDEICNKLFRFCKDEVKNENRGQNYVADLLCLLGSCLIFGIGTEINTCEAKNLLLRAKNISSSSIIDSLLKKIHPTLKSKLFHIQEIVDKYSKNMVEKDYLDFCNYMKECFEMSEKENQNYYDEEGTQIISINND